MSYYYSGYRKQNRPKDSTLTGVDLIQVSPSSGRRSQTQARWRVASLSVATLLMLLLIVTPVWSPAMRQRQIHVLESEELTHEISVILPETTEKYGIYVKVLETGEEFLLGDGVYTAASCYKMPLGLLMYSMASAGDANLDDEVEFTKEDWEAGTGVLQATRPGTEFTIRKLVELAIVESDNIAGNMLLRTVGREALAEFYRDSGAAVIPGDRNVSSPRDMGRFAEKVVHLAATHPELGGELLGYMLESKVKDRLALKLPGDVVLANKIGTWPGAVNDVGIAISDHFTYVIAVMSDGVGNPDRGAAKIADLSLAVYEHIASRVKPGAMGLGIGRTLLDEGS